MSLTSNYYYPKIHNVSVERNDPNFTVEAQMSYCPVYVDGENTEHNNSCIIRCRYRQLPNGEYYPWVTILESDDPKVSGTYEIVTADLKESESYEVVVGALDALGNEANTSIILPATDVFMDRDGELNAISIGEAATEENTVSVAEKLAVIIKGILTAGMLKVSGLKIEDNTVTLDGPGESHFRVTVPWSEISGTDSVTMTLTTDAGILDIGCHPVSEALEITMWNKGAGTELKLGAVEDRVLLTGLTAPVDESDAVNKAYVDALIARIQTLEEKLQ